MYRASFRMPLEILQQLFEHQLYVVLKWHQVFTLVVNWSVLEETYLRSPKRYHHLKTSVVQENDLAPSGEKIAPSSWRRQWCLCSFLEGCRTLASIYFTVKCFQVCVSCSPPACHDNLDADSSGPLFGGTVYIFSTLYHRRKLAMLCTILPSRTSETSRRLESKMVSSGRREYGRTNARLPLRELTWDLVFQEQRESRSQPIRVEHHSSAEPC